MYLSHYDLVKISYLSFHEITTAANYIYDKKENNYKIMTYWFTVSQLYNSKLSSKHFQHNKSRNRINISSKTKVSNMHSKLKIYCIFENLYSIYNQHKTTRTQCIRQYSNIIKEKKNRNPGALRFVDMLA